MSLPEPSSKLSLAEQQAAETFLCRLDAHFQSVIQSMQGISQLPPPEEVRELCLNTTCLICEAYQEARRSSALPEASITLSPLARDGCKPSFKEIKTANQADSQGQRQEYVTTPESAGFFPYLLSIHFKKLSKTISSHQPHLPPARFINVWCHDATHQIWSAYYHAERSMQLPNAKRSSLIALYRMNYCRKNSSRESHLLGKDTVLGESDALLCPPGGIDTSNCAVGIGRALVQSVLDEDSINHIAPFAHRMKLCTLKENQATFSEEALTSQQVMDYMRADVGAICVSYKHTRRCLEGLPADRRRVHSAVQRFTKLTGFERMLFWADVTGRSPEGLPWAQQGVDPYVCIPTLRVVSEHLRAEIDDSFWMTVELCAAFFRGGMVTYNEDTEELVHSPDAFARPLLELSPSLPKLMLARLICNPLLFYRRARCEEDKIEVLKYAVSTATSTEILPHSFELNDGLICAPTPADQLQFQTLTSIPVNFGKIFDRLDSLSRPQCEIVVKGGQWHAYEEVFPAIKSLEPSARRAINVGAKTRFTVFESSRENDDVTRLLIWVYQSAEYCVPFRALHLKVREYRKMLRMCTLEPDGDTASVPRLVPAVTGKVLSFRLATEQEENMMSRGAGTRVYLDLE